ncbi:hypothetical protein V8C26DRAFT_584 [Trichoderma gracile]
MARVSVSEDHRCQCAASRKDLAYVATLPGPTTPCYLMCKLLASRINTCPQGFHGQLLLHNISRQYPYKELEREALRNILDTRGALLASSASLPCRSAALSTSLHCKYEMRNEFTLSTFVDSHTEIPKASYRSATQMAGSMEPNTGWHVM